MLARHYAHALYSLSLAPDASPKALMAGLQKVLARRGHKALLPRIAGELSKVQTEALARSGVVVRIAEAQEKKVALAKAKELLAERGMADAPIEVVEDESLTAGFVVDGPGFRFDASARASLIALYRTMTAQN